MKITKIIILLSCFTYNIQFSHNLSIEYDVQIESQNAPQVQGVNEVIDSYCTSREQAIQFIEDILHQIIDGENQISLLQHLDDVQKVKHHFCPIKDKKHIVAIEHFVINKEELIHTPNNFMPSIKNISKPIRLYKAYCQLPGKKPKYESTKQVTKILFEKCDKASQELKEGRQSW